MIESSHYDNNPVVDQEPDIGAVPRLSSETEPSGPTTLAEITRGLQVAVDGAAAYSNETISYPEVAAVETVPTAEVDTTFFGDSVTEVLRNGSYSKDELKDFVATAFELANRSTAVQSEQETTGSNLKAYQEILSALTAANPLRVGTIYTGEKYAGPEQVPYLHHMARELSTAPDKYGATLLDFYRTAFGAPHLNDLARFAPRDPELQTLLHSDTFIEELPSLVTRDIEQQYLESDKQWSEVTASYWEAMLPLYLPDAEVCADTLYAGWERATGAVSETKDKDGNLLTATSIQNIAKTASYFGPEGIRALRDKAGIVNFGYSQPDELVLTYGAVESNPDTLEYLKGGDVTIIFRDEMYDPMGTLSGDHEIFTGPGKRTLVLGITKPEDFAHHRELLLDIGVKASTVVFSSHGYRGSFGFGKDSMVTNHLPEGADSSLHANVLTAQGVIKDLDSIMQDSRGADDNPEAKGRRRFILNACDQALPAEVARPLYSASADGTTDVLDRAVPESMAETFQKALLRRHRRFDVYAFDGTDRFKATNGGVRIKGLSPETTLYRFSVDDDGSPINVAILEAPLYRPRNQGPQQTPEAIAA